MIHQTLDTQHSFFILVSIICVSRNCCITFFCLSWWSRVVLSTHSFFDQRVVCSHMEQSPSYSWLLTLIAQQGSRHVTLRPVHAAEQGARPSRSGRPRRFCCSPRSLRQYQPTFNPRTSKTIVRNIGHSDDEIDMAGLTSLEGMEVGIIKPKAGSCGFFDGHGEIVLSSGRQHNLRCVTDRDPRVPAAVLTGFLGSGKTTLLNTNLSLARSRAPMKMCSRWWTASSVVRSVVTRSKPSNGSTNKWGRSTSFCSRPQVWLTPLLWHRHTVLTIVLL